MRQARGLLPYLGFSGFVVVASVLALFVSTLQMPVGSPDTAASTTPGASALVRPATDLSSNGHLAYWRSEPNGDYLLWVANTDGSRRRSIAHTDRPTAVSRTRWSADGNAVSYIDGGGRLDVVRLDGTETLYALPMELRQNGFHILDQHFSPSGNRIAATVQHANLPEYDVVLSTPTGSWTRLTTTQDVTAFDWISEDELLVATTRGLIGRLDVNGTDRLTALTSVAGASPLIGDDGRVHFLADRAGSTAANGPPQLSSEVRVWNVTVDGDELRQESLSLAGVPQGSFTLDGTWPNGYLVHRGAADQLIAVGAGLASLPGSAGTIQRLAVSPDHRYAIGVTSSSIVRLDFNASATIANPVLLLGSVDQADVWFPRIVTLARVPRPNRPGPAVRYMFQLGAHLWTMSSDGIAHLLAGGSTMVDDAPQQSPQCSPSGDRVLVTEAIPSGPGVAFVPVVVTTDGKRQRYGAIGDIAGVASWSPDGSHFVAVGTPRDLRGPFADVTAELNVTTFDVADPRSVSVAMPGRAANWTRAGIVVLSNGTYRSGDRARDDQILEMWNQDMRRQIATIAALTSDARSEAPVERRGVVRSGAVTATADGAYVGLHLTYLTGVSGAPSRNPDVFVVVRTRDGAATTFIGADDAVSGETWSPVGHLVGYTRSPGRPPYGDPPAHAVIRDVETGAVLLDVDGRFAGWSPDGSWAFVARPDGLFGRVVAGGDLVRIAPYDVLVCTTRP